MGRALDGNPDSVHTPRAKWKPIPDGWSLPGTGYTIIRNKRRLKLFPASPAAPDKVYDWLLCRDGRPIAEIGDRYSDEAKRKAEHAISRYSSDHPVSAEFLRRPAP